MPKHSDYALIFDQLVLPAGAQILVPYARSAAPLLELSARSAGGRVVAVAPELPDYTRLQQEVGPKAGAEIEVVLEKLDADLGTRFDCALLDTDGPAGRGNPYTFQLIDLMVRHVRPDGSVWLQGSSSRGVRTFSRHLESRCGTVEATGIGGGKRAFRAIRPAGEVTAAETETRQVSVEAHGVQFALTLEPGVFGGRKVDPASIMLIEALQLPERSEILDLGCGAGIIGIAAAFLCLSGHVTMVDSSPQAVALSSRNVADNHLSNVTVLLSDVYSAVQARRFDVVATNPPFHQHSHSRRDIAERFMREAPDHLAPGGRFYIVANAFLPYQREMAEVFDEVQVLAETRQYRVLMGTQRDASAAH